MTLIQEICHRELPKHVVLVDNKVAFIGNEVTKNGTEIETRAYRKPTNTCLPLDFQSQVDKLYKTGLLKTMLHRAYALSSTTETYNEECTRLRSIFCRLDYPVGLIDSTINIFVHNASANNSEKKTDDCRTIRIVQFPIKIR